MHVIFSTSNLTTLPTRTTLSKTLHHSGQDSFGYVNFKNPVVGSDRGLTQIDSRTKATAQVSEETGNGDDKDHCIEFAGSKLGTTFDAMDRAFNVSKKLIGKGTGKKDRKAPRWALTKFLILVMEVSGYLATSIVRCRMVDRYKVCVTVSLLSDDFEDCSLKTLSPAIKIFDTDPLSDPVSCEGTLEGYKYVPHVTPLFHISVRDRQKEFIEPSLQEAEFVMRAAVEANINWTVTTSLTAAVGFLQILTNTATKLRTCPKDHLRRVPGSPA